MDEDEKRELIERIDREFDNSPKGRIAKEVIEELPDVAPENPSDGGDQRNDDS